MGTQIANVPTMEQRIENALHGKSLEALLDMVGQELPDITIEAAVRELVAAGVRNCELDSTAVKAVYAVQDAAFKREEAGTTIANILGVIKAAKSYSSWKAPDGKNYKDFKSFCKDFFPALDYKTLSLYADVGAFIYTPIASGLPAYSDFKEFANFTPSKLKNLVAVFKDSARLLRLAEHIPEDIQSMKRSDIEAAAKATKAASPRTQGDRLESESERRVTINLQKLFLFGKSDAGEMDVLIPDPKAAKDVLISMDKDACAAFVKWFVANIK